MTTLSTAAMRQAVDRLRAQGYPPIDGDAYHVLAHPSQVIALMADPNALQGRPRPTSGFEIDCCTVAPDLRLFVHSGTPPTEMRVVARGAVDVVALDPPTRA